MTYPYIVQATDMHVFPQRNSPTHDGMPDENANANCGEAAICSILRRYGILRGNDWYEPDDIKDWLDGQYTAGPNVITYNTQVQNALAHFGNIPTLTLVPNGKQNGTNGLLDLEWQYLDRGIPVAEVAAWIDDSGVVHPTISHWIVVDYQTEARVRSLDPWPLPSGGTRDEDYATHYARSKQLLVVPTIPPPATVA